MSVALLVATSLSIQSKISFHSPAFSLDCHFEQVVSVEDVDSIRHKSEVVNAAVGDSELAKKDAFRVPAVK